MELRLGCGVDLVAEQLALAVQRLQVGRDEARAGQIRRRQEFHGDVGIGQSAQRVHPRRDDEADVFFAQAVRAQPGAFHEQLQPQAARLPQDVQAALEQIARVVAHLSQVGHDAQRDEIEQAVRSLRPAGAAVELLGQLVGDADAGEGGERESGGAGEQGITDGRLTFDV